LKNNLFKSVKLTNFFLAIIVISTLFAFQTNAKLNEAQKTEITKEFLQDASIKDRAGLETKLVSGELINLTPNQKEYIKDHLLVLCNSLRWIKKLELYNCNLESLPDEISNLKLLTLLDLSHNKLQNLPISFYKLSGLQSLYLSSNNINSLPEDIEGLKSLYDLNLSKNNLNTLPNNFIKLLQLRYLNIEENKLTCLPQEIEQLCHLMHLNLNKNNIEKLPNNFVYLKNLKFFHAQFNKLKELPDNFEKLIKIQVIDLYHNKIDFLPYSFEQLYTLTDLNMGSNKLKKLPRHIGQLRKLKHLTLEDNTELSQIPNSLTDLKDSLESLNLLYTNIPKNSKKKLGRKKLQMHFEDRVVFFLENPNSSK
jgi:internalin A